MTVPQSELVHLELDPTPVLIAHAQHRRRFASEVASLDDDALATPSRCHKWSVADVLRHLNDVDSWMDDIWHGRPPPLAGGFDPNVTPHEFVMKTRSTPDAGVRDQFIESCEWMAGFVEHRAPEQWGDPSISPLGAVPWWFSALHMFFDSWLHERDCLVPLGVDTPVDDAELRPVLSYILGLAGTFGGETVDTVVEGLRVRAGTTPVVVTPVGAIESPLAAADLADALSGRGEAAAIPPRLGGLARFLTPVD